MSDKYSMHLTWSEEDGAYLVRVAELPGCMADGATPAEAVAAAQLVIEDWIAAAKEEGRPVPPSITNEGMEQASRAAAEQFTAFLTQQVQNVVEQVRLQIQLNPALAAHDPADFWKR